MKCVMCHDGQLQVGTTSLTYSRDGSLFKVQVDGIPAEICPVCGEALLSEAVAENIFDIVNPLLEAGQRMRQQMVLPAPTVDIHFPPLAPRQLRRAIAA